MKKRLSAISLLVALATLFALFSVLTVPTNAAEGTIVDVSENATTDLPPRFGTDQDMFELEDLYDEDGNGCLHNVADEFDYYYLKGDYQSAYMRFPFEVDRDGTYEICIGLMAIRSSVPRSAELSINGESRYYIESNYGEVPDGELHEEYVPGITAYLRKGKNVLTIYLGSTFDNVNMKSLFFDKFFFYRTGDLPAGYVFPDVGQEEEIDITGAVSEKVTFNRNFKSLISSTVFCTAEYVTDEEKGEVMELSATENLEPFRFTFSFSKYMKILGKDPDTETCEEYSYLVLPIRADGALAGGSVNFFYYTAGFDVIDYGQMLTEEFACDGKWQYLLFDMSDESGWYADFKGGTFFFGDTGSEPGTKLRVAELALFKTYKEAAVYAGMEVPDESTQTSESDTSTAEETSEAPTAELTTAPDITTVTGGETKAADTTDASAKGNGCGSALGCGILLTLLPAVFVTVQSGKRKKDRS